MSASPEMFRTAATDIAEQLMREALHDGDRACWRATSKPPSGDPEWILQPSIYNGSAGVAAFLLEASHVLGEQRYRDLAFDGLGWAEREMASRSDYSFYSGRLGVGYVMLRAAELTGDSEWIERALRLARGYESFLTTRLDDLLSGAASAALGFLHLHAATGESWTATAAERFLRRIVSTAHWTSNGVTWCSERENIRGLCGLAHGNAGLVFVLLEASRYFDAPGLKTLAREALRYENAYFDPANRSWPDFRKLGHYDDEEFGRQYGHQPPEFFLTPGTYEGWCHGAPGIGLSRARAFEIFGPEWEDDLRKALNKTRQVSVRPASFTLCHGGGGNAFLFIEAARVLREPQWFAVAEEIGCSAVESKARLGRYLSGFHTYPEREELVLMLGNAGIGYLFLSLLAPDIPNLLLPRVASSHAESSLSWIDAEVARHLMRAHMPRTMALIEEAVPAEVDAFFSGWHDREEALAFVVSMAGRVDGGNSLASLETSKIDMYDHCPSFALARFQKWSLARKAAQRLSERNFDNVTFRLAPYVRFWRSNDEAHLLRIEGATVVDDPLSPLAEAVLTCFEERRTLDDAVQAVGGGFDTGADDGAIRAAVERQVNAALAAALLETAADCHDDNPPQEAGQQPQ